MSKPQYNSWTRWFCGGPELYGSYSKSWAHSFCDYIGANRWGRGIIIMLLVLMIILFLCEAIYYLVGSFRFRDEHVGVWHILFLSFEALLVIPYILLYFFISRWYHLWDASMRTSERDVLELNLALPLTVAILVSLQVLSLQRYGITVELPILGPHAQNLVAYRRLNYMAGLCAAVCCYVVYRCVPVFTRKAPTTHRWVAQNIGSNTRSSIASSSMFKDSSVVDKNA
jgi:hypothetical protein